MSLRALGPLSYTTGIVLVAIMTGLTTVATVVIAIPFPWGGYLNFGDVLVMLSGMVLGPVGGLFAGGVGSAMADIALGYHMFAPVTLVSKGTEGLVVGYFSLKSSTPSRLTKWDLLGIVLGACAMLTGYFVAEVFLLGIEPAVAELVLVNSIQVTVGGTFTAAFGPRIRSLVTDSLHGPPEEDMPDSSQ
ncbi:MAG: ECF transporter S component [Candidatus Thorarchaeota archaeon]|nr:ECF transporter S component [Candidatus Thorarchaeota archaeon]